MQIIFKRIELHNFMSFESESFDFDSCVGMNLVQGKNNDIPNSKNGVGKSQLYLSLLYALFGQLQSKIKNENIINRYANSKDMIVVLTFDVDGQQYKIRRSINKGKNSNLELFSYDNTISDYVDITKSTIAETQEFIEKDIIHCDITIFLRTILLTADQTYNFYMLKKSDKKEFVEKMFDIGVFEDMYKSIHRNVLDYDKEVIACQHRLLTLNKTKDDYINGITKYDEQHKQQLSELNSLLNELINKKEDLDKKLLLVDANTIDALEDEIETIETQRSSIFNDITNISDKISQINLGIHKIDESIALRQKNIDKHSDLMAKLCNDCKSIFANHYNLEVFLDEIKEFNTKKHILEKTLLECNANKEQKQHDYDSFNDELITLKNKFKQLNNESSKYMQDIAITETKINSCKSNIDKLKNQVNPYEDMLAQCKVNIENEDKTLNDYDTKLKYLKFAENIVSQDTIRKFIIKDLVVLLNNKIKTYLTRLGAQYYVEFDEDMDYEFITHTGTCEWSNFSAGERMRIMIATSFAFRDFMSIRNGLNSNILILDEYFDSAIDTLCVENVISILKEYSINQNQNIFVISHRPEVGIEQFNRVIQVEKTNGIAHVSFH